MPRPKRYFLDRSCYHITHRCHNRDFLLRFSKYRDLYLHALRSGKERFRIHILDYMITSNHIHLLLWAGQGNTIPLFMQYIQGEFAQQYNLLKKRHGSVWQDRYHATLIQDGNHFSRCLYCIAFNMVRARVVEHPRKWRHSGYQELTGERQRYRIVDLNRLLKCLRTDDVIHFREWYIQTIEQKVELRYHAREPFWSDALAVGDEHWLKKVVGKISSRKRINIDVSQTASVNQTDVAEPRTSYYAT